MTGAVIAIGVSVVGKIIWDWLRGRGDLQLPHILQIVENMNTNLNSLSRIVERTNGSGRPLVYFNEDSIDKIDELKTDLKSLPVVLNRILLEIQSIRDIISSALGKTKD